MNKTILILQTFVFACLIGKAQPVDNSWRGEYMGKKLSLKNEIAVEAKSRRNALDRNNFRSLLAAPNKQTNKQTI